MSGELKPCPFCGSDKVSFDIMSRDADGEPSDYSPECLSCGATIISGAGEKLSKERATTLWNARAELSSLRGEADVIGRLVGALEETQGALTSAAAEAKVDGGGTCLFIAGRLDDQMCSNAALLASLPDTVLPRPRRNASPSEVKTGRQGIGEV